MQTSLERSQKNYSKSSKTKSNKENPENILAGRVITGIKTPTENSTIASYIIGDLNSDPSENWWIPLEYFQNSVAVSSILLSIAWFI